LPKAEPWRVPIVERLPAQPRPTLAFRAASPRSGALYRLATASGTKSTSSQGIVDRVTFNAHILETGTTSYRLRTSETATDASGLAERRRSGKAAPKSLSIR
jgi:hypothetical protein